jgi:hypothetical protein
MQRVGTARAVNLCELHKLVCARLCPPYSTVEGQAASSALMVT